MADSYQGQTMPSPLNRATMLLEEVSLSIMEMIRVAESDEFEDDDEPLNFGLKLVAMATKVGHAQGLIEGHAGTEPSGEILETRPVPLEPLPTDPVGNSG